VIQYASLFSFPTIGNERNLYVDQENERAYRWDAVQMRYFCVGSDWNEIERIIGGGTNV